MPSSKLSCRGPKGRRETVLAEAAPENPDALSDKNAGHALALDSLEVIAEALDDIDFADANARLLFPPPPKPTDELIVRGADWALFRRRRDKKCQEENPRRDRRLVAGLPGLPRIGVQPGRGGGLEKAAARKRAAAGGQSVAGRRGRIRRRRGDAGHISEHSGGLAEGSARRDHYLRRYRQS